MRAASAALALALAASSASAQAVVGRALVEGERVVLYADGTWAPEAAPVKDCREVAQALTFCGSPAEWISLPPAGPMIAAQYRVTDRLFAQVIAEALGTDDGLSAKAMREIVLHNAASVAGVPASDVVVADVVPCEADGIAGETVYFSLASTNGLRVVFGSCIVVLERRTFQLITYEIASDLTDAHPGLHDRFLSLIRIDGAAR